MTRIKHRFSTALDDAYSLTKYAPAQNEHKQGNWGSRGNVPKVAWDIRFGPFTVNLTTGEIHKRGVRIALSGQAFQLNRRGDLALIEIKVDDAKLEVISQVLNYVCSSTPIENN